LILIASQPAQASQPIQRSVWRDVELINIPHFYHKTRDFRAGYWK
jgi:hypothetical protein